MIAHVHIHRRSRSWNKFKNSPGLVVSAFTLIGLIFFFGWGYCHLEAYCFFYPSIDTQFSPGFSEEKFDLIQSGMSEQQVRNLLAEPLAIQKKEYDGTEDWHYSMDGKCSWGDFAWLGRIVEFKNGMVLHAYRTIIYD